MKHISYVLFTLLLTNCTSSIHASVSLQIEPIALAPMDFEKNVFFMRSDDYSFFKKFSEEVILHAQNEQKILDLGKEAFNLLKSRKSIANFLAKEGVDLQTYNPETFDLVMASYELKKADVRLPNPTPEQQDEMTSFRNVVTVQFSSMNVINGNLSRTGFYLIKTNF